LLFSNSGNRCISCSGLPAGTAGTGRVHPRRAAGTAGTGTAGRRVRCARVAGYNPYSCTRARRGYWYGYEGTRAWVDGYGYENFLFFFLLLFLFYKYFFLLFFSSGFTGRRVGYWFDVNRGKNFWNLNFAGMGAGTTDFFQEKRDRSFSNPYPFTRLYPDTGTWVRIIPGGF
jgi:hypothetical protein